MSSNQYGDGQDSSRNDNYAGYDHSTTDEGGYGSNSRGNAFSRSNQMGVGEDEAEGIRRTSHYGSSNDVDDKTSAAFERTRSNEGRPKQQQQQAPTSAFAKDSDVDTSQGDGGNYSGYDHSTGEGGYGTNSRGDAYSRFNQMGVDDSPSQPTGHYGNGQQERREPSGSNNGSEYTGSGYNTPSIGGKAALFEMTGLGTEGTTGEGAESARRHQDFGHNSADNIGA